MIKMDSTKLTVFQFGVAVVITNQSGGSSGWSCHVCCGSLKNPLEETSWHMHPSQGLPHYCHDLFV